MAEKQIFNGETHRVGTPLVGAATPTPLMNCCFAGNTNFLVVVCHSVADIVTIRYLNMH